jgi:hypothetical protein
MSQPILSATSPGSFRVIRSLAADIAEIATLDDDLLFSASCLLKGIDNLVPASLSSCLFIVDVGKVSGY